MSELDKTGKKLIDSIRMTKEGPATAAVKSVTKKKASHQSVKKQKSHAASTSKSTAATTKVKTTSGVSPKSSKKPKSTADNRNKQASKKTVTIADVPYQDGSQVWPD
jgi:hypothetical protein